MNKFNNWLWILLFGSLWGVSEVVVGEALFGNRVPYASVWLTTWAFFVLAAGRGILNKPGSSAAIGAVTVIFKLATASPFFCHLLAIFILGLTFDVFSTLLMRNERNIFWKSSVSGVFGIYSGRALFALAGTYIIHWEFWTAGGVKNIIGHVLVGGSIAALLALMVVPLGYWIGVNWGTKVEFSHRWAFACMIATLTFLWTLGSIV